MADIKKELNAIKNAVYGKEVRGSIHDGIKKINDEVENATDLSESAKHQVENIQQQVNQLVVEGDSSVEAAQARVDSKGNVYSTLKQRLDDKETTFEKQLEQKADKTELNTIKSELNTIKSELNVKASKEYVDERFGPIDGLTTDIVNIYVDSEHGSDDNDGTIEAPFKTIQKAFDSIPKIINKDHIINCAPGVYDEEAYITGVIGAGVMLRAYGDNIPPVDRDIACRVKALRFYDMMGYVHIADFGSFGTPTIESRAAFLFSRCIYAAVSRCRFTSNSIGTTKRTLEWDGSKGSVGTSYFANQHICVLSINGSAVRVDDTNMAGSGNNYALFAQSGLIFKKGNNTWINNANTPEREHEGGKIW